MVRKAGVQFSLYVGGQLVASDADTGGSLTAPAFKLGRHATLLGFGGFIDELRIYGRALLPAQIQALASGQVCK
jgi:hypothetical protein